MYYLELIHRFWEFNKTAKISPSGICLYLYLLKTAFENDRYDFKISDSKIARELGLTRKTVKTTKEKLQTTGLIKFETANGVPCYYRVLLNYSFTFKSDNILELDTVALENILKSDPADISLPPANYQQLHSDTPSLKKFMEYVKTLENYEPQLDSIIKEKYNNWINNGWKNSSNRPINDWKLTLKSALPYMKNSEGDGLISIENVPNVKRPEV